MEKKVIKLFLPNKIDELEYDYPVVQDIFTRINNIYSEKELSFEAINYNANVQPEENTPTSPLECCVYFHFESKIETLPVTMENSESNTLVVYSKEGDNLVDICKQILFFVEEYFNASPKDEKNNHQLAQTYQLAGELFFVRNKAVESKDYLHKAINIWHTLSQENSLFLSNLAEVHTLLGLTSGTITEFLTDEAKADYKHALKARKQLDTSDLLLSQNDVAKNLDELTQLCLYLNQLEDATFYKEKSLAVWTEVNTSNIELHKANLAKAHRELGRIYHQREMGEKALEHYHKSIDLLLQLSKDDPEEYQRPLLETYNDLICLYINDQEMQMAITYLEQEITIKEELYQEDSEKYKNTLLCSYHTLCTVYMNIDQREKAKVYREKMMELLED